MNIYQKRVSCLSDLKSFLYKACKDLDLGIYKAHRIIEVGYEDLNIFVNTDKHPYFFKILADFRGKADKVRYSQIIQAVGNSRVSHPYVFRLSLNHPHSITVDGSTVYFFVMQFIHGKSFYEMGIKPSRQEIAFLSKQAALINKLEISLPIVYDNWALINFIQEYTKVKKYLNKRDNDFLEPLAQRFSQVNLKSIPHCFVHGDIIDTNVIRDKFNKLWIIDFSASNYYPRIQELAVLSCSLLFDPHNKATFLKNYQLALAEYEKVSNLSFREKNLLPIFIKVAHAMHIIGATNSILSGEDSDENQYWLNLGRQGLALTSDIWC